jgi:hypothetical protein
MAFTAARRAASARRMGGVHTFCAIASRVINEFIIVQCTHAHFAFEKTESRFDFLFNSNLSVYWSESDKIGS